MASDWILNFDSAPFCNGSLHVGHARNYVLGDAHARWLALRGNQCRYVTALDAFGLPNAGSPDGMPRSGNTRQIRRQFRELGLTHSATPPSTDDPGYYRWTQWLFLELWSAGLVYWRRARVHYCLTCATVLAASQSEDGECWRCGGSVTRRRQRVGYVRTSAYESELRRSIDRLRGWSDRSRNLLRAAMSDERSARGAGDWVVSRDHAWGTPVPAVDCRTCGVVPVPASALPVRHAIHGGPASQRCGRCGDSAPLVRQTLDCFFDDAWCFYAGAKHWKPGDDNPFLAWRDNPPREVHFHAGFDTYAYLPLYRFIGRFLWERGYSPRAEPIDVYHGHDVITSDGRKVSKRYGNGPDLDALIRRYGTDILRLSVLVGVNPARPLEWSNRQIEMATRFYRMATRLSDHNSTPLIALETDRTGKERTRGGAILATIDQFIDSYRMAAALDRLYTATRASLRAEGTTPANTPATEALLVRWLIFCPQLMHAVQRSRTARAMPVLTRQTA